MTEKTVEQLQLELDAIRKHNLEVELAAEQVKVAKQQEELKKKEQEELEVRITEKVKTQLGYNGKSKLNETATQQSMNLTGNKSLEQFKASFIKTAQNKGLKVSGRSYIEIMEGLSQGEYARKGGK